MPSPARLDRVPALWLVLAAIVSIQLGASVGKGLFPAIGPFGAGFLRLAAAGAFLLIVARPRLRGRSRRDWLLLAAFTATLLVMNVSIYLAFVRIPIGAAVTLEFLGPLTVSIVGSRRPLDFLWVALAAAGVALLGLRGMGAGATDGLGIALALLAGICWAGYIVLGARVGESWRATDALALACAAGGLALAGPAFASVPSAAWTVPVVATGATVGLLSSVIPYVLELIALRRLPRRLFGILMSLEPAVAALMAFLVLREALTPRQLLAMACVVAASAGATVSNRRARSSAAT